MTAKELGALEISPKSGAEPFRLDSAELEFKLQDFWRWSSSDLAGNRLRGLLAEFLVGTALGCVSGCRSEWDAYDLETSEGVRIEVKSAAYVQTWKQQRPSSIRYNVRPAQGWTAKTNEWSSEVMRRAHLYVFCLLAHQDQETLDPLDLDQWEFYCIRTSVLDERIGTQKTISHSRLLALDPVKAAFPELSDVIFRLADISTS